MSITGLPDPYCDVTYADGVNSSSEWTAASDTEKEAALQWARVYLDGTYVCSWDDDTPDNVKTANAILADEYLRDSSKFFAVDTSSGIKKEKVVAGSVTSETEYNVEASDVSVDTFPHITALIGNVCYIPSSDFGVSVVLRR